MAILTLILRSLKESGSVRSWALILTMAMHGIGYAQPSQENQIKAVFLFNFTQFIEWPASSFAHESTPIVIGILGKDPFGAYLDETVRDEKIDNHPLIVQRFKTANEITKCHILYINMTDKDQLKTIFENLKSQNTLTVGDASNFAKYGGMIRFYTENNKTRIRVNLDAVKSTELVVSSKLLRLADVVETKQD